MPRPPIHAAFVLFLLPFALAQTPSPTASTSPNPPSRRLLFAAELCRHGDRSPIDDFPNDALPAPKWPEGVGQLTAVGMRAHYELGQRMRKRYVDSGFLPPSYNVAHVYIRSTNVDRTLMSAASQMAGFYPPGSPANEDVREKFGGEPLEDGEGGLPALFQPVPVHTVRKDDDDMLLVGNACARHDQLMERKHHEPEWRHMVEENDEFIEVVKGIVGSEKDDFGLLDVEKVSDTWTVFAQHSVPLPKKATPDIVDHARNLSNWLIGYGNKGLEINRLRAGVLLHEIKLRLSAAAMKDAGELPDEHKDFAKKFVLYSAHDTTVAAALAGLQVFNNEYPPYNSTLIWELHKEDNGSLTVHVEFNENSMLLPGCGDVYCPLYDYLQSTKARTVPGKRARQMECLTGFSRLRSMAGSIFRRQPMDELSSFGLSPETDNSDSGGVLAKIAITLAGLLALILVVRAIVSFRSHYKGYARTALDAPSDSYGLRGERANMSDRRILM